MNGIPRFIRGNWAPTTDNFLPPPFDFLLHLTSDARIHKVQLISELRNVNCRGTWFSTTQTVTDDGKTLELEVTADPMTLNQKDRSVCFGVQVLPKKNKGGEEKSIRMDLPTNVFSVTSPTFRLPPISSSLWANASPSFVLVQVHFRHVSVDDFRLETVDVNHLYGNSGGVETIIDCTAATFDKNEASSPIDWSGYSTFDKNEASSTVDWSEYPNMDNLPPF